MTSATAPVWPAGVTEVYRPSVRPRMVEVPELTYLAIDGGGDPNTALAYAEAVEALYTASYAARFDLKRSAGLVYRVMPLEGLWSTRASGDVWAAREAWEWTMMIAQPEAVVGDVLDRALAAAARKRPGDSLRRLRLERLAEGPAAQVLHVGPYGEAELPTVEALHRFIADEGRSPRGRHHEIYLSDARRTAPERLRTIIRQPMEPQRHGQRP